MLIVEDEFLLAMELELLLDQHGLRVLGPASSLDAALALLNDRRPNAAIIDINLKGKSVLPVAEALRASSVPFVVVSAYSREAVSGTILADAP